MIRRLTKIIRLLGNRAHTLTELLIASVVIILLFASVLGALIITKEFSSKAIAAANLQRDVDVIVGRIVRGVKEGTGILGLRSAVSFSLPVINPAGSQIDFVGIDGNARRYYLSGNSIIYASPTQSPLEKTIYTAPANSNITLRFWEPTEYSDHETVGIYISVSQQLGDRTLSGSLSTYANLRNLPK